MIASLWRGASGMQANRLRVDSLAHDIANVNTPGYKRGQVEFRELLQRVIREGGMPVDRPRETALAPALGAGVRAISREKDFSQGALLATGQPLDLAIQGQGFFPLVGPDGGWYFTRNGSFHLDNEGNLVNGAGYFLDIPFGMPPEAEKIVINSEGLITAEIDGEIQEIGEINLAYLPNPAGMEAVGDNLYRETEASGLAYLGRPGTEGLGILRPGYLEASNVELVTAMTQIILAQRAYELSSRSVRIADEMWGLANNLRG